MVYYDKLITYLFKFLIVFIKYLYNFVFRWKHLIPTLLHTIKDEKEIEYDGILMTGEEVKCRVITSICIIRWRENVMVPLADMFKYNNLKYIIQSLLKKK